MIGVSIERGRWAVDLGGGVFVRRRTLTRARRTALTTGGSVRHWQRMGHPATAQHAWISPLHPLKGPENEKFKRPGYYKWKAGTWTWIEDARQRTTRDPVTAR